MSSTKGGYSLNNQHTRFREPFSGFSHLVGLVLSIAGTVTLVLQSIKRGTTWHIVSFAIFGASLILLYAASSLYHLLPLGEQGIRILQRIDHMMIYILIAGTYTPFCLVPLRGAWGWALLVPIWLTAFAGVIITAFQLSTPRWVNTAIYVVMGWIVAIAAKPLLATVPGGFAWLLTGGLLYTIGAVCYGTKWPRLKPGVFGFHELWHLFVMAGSISHYWAVFRYVAFV